MAASLAAATIFCTAFHFWRAPQHMSPWHAIQVAALAAVVLSIARSLCLEASYQVMTVPACVALARHLCSPHVMPVATRSRVQFNMFAQMDAGSSGTWSQTCCCPDDSNI